MLWRMESKQLQKAAKHIAKKNTEWDIAEVIEKYLLQS